MLSSMRYFHAVTLALGDEGERLGVSEYRISVNGGRPILRKVKLNGASALPVGESLAGKSMLAVGTKLILFDPVGENGTIIRQVELIPEDQWGERTSWVVALFLDERLAEKCFATPSLIPNDQRWHEETKRVLVTLARNTVFNVCSSHLALFQSEEVAVGL